MPDDEQPEKKKTSEQLLEEIAENTRPPEPLVMVMTREEWDALPVNQRTAFLGRGGTIRDLSEEERDAQTKERRKAAIAGGAMLRSEWDKLNPEARAKFLSAGGKLAD